MNTVSNPFIPLVLPLVLFLFFWGLFYFGLRGLWYGIRYGVQRASLLVVRTGLKSWSGKNRRVSALMLYLPMILILVAGGVAAFAAGDFFGDLGESFRRSNSNVIHVDQAVNLWFRTERFKGLTVLFETMTNVGGPIGMAVIAACIVALLIRKERVSAIYMAITVVGGVLLNVGLKLLYARARPDVATAISVAQGQSFPSGHAMGSFIVLGSIGYLLLRRKFSWKKTSTLLAAIATLIVLIGLSRVYLGVHWTSDIIAGWSAGTVWLATTTVALEVYSRLRLLKRGVTPSIEIEDVSDKPDLSATGKS